MSTLLQQKIQSYLDQEKLSLAAFERQAGLKINVARNIMRGQSKRPTGHTLNAIAKILNCAIGDLMEEKSPEKKRSPDSKLVELPKLLEDVLRQIHLHAQRPLTLNETFYLIEEIYRYTARKNPPQIDPDFVSWIIEGRL